MKEYTFLAFGSVLLTIGIDFLSRVYILKNKKFWLYIVLFTILMMIVNGYITAQGIVQYNPSYFSGIRVTTIPLEDFFYNFSLVTLSIILWEFFKRKTSR